MSCQHQAIAPEYSVDPISLGCGCGCALIVMAIGLAVFILASGAAYRIVTWAWEVSFP